MDPHPDYERSNTWIWIAAVVVLIVVVGGGIWFWLAAEDGAPRATGAMDTAPDEDGNGTAEMVPPPGAPLGPPEDEAADLPRSERWAQIIGGLPDWPLEPEERLCRIADEDLINLIRGPMAGEQDAEPFIDRDSLAAMAIELARNPPVPSGEVADPDALLANAFHFYRVLGEKRALALLELAEERPADLEPLAAAGYRWLLSRQACGAGVEREITLRALYDYATFLLETFGGHSYLHRRMPREEALLTLYALMVVDRARDEGISPHGTDPRPSLERCRALIEEQPLAYREEYLEILDGIDSRWP